MAIKNNKIMSIVFISTCAIFLLLLFLHSQEILNRINYSLHEFSAVLINACFIIIPVEMIIGFIIWIKYRREKDKSYLLNFVLNMASVLILVLCVSIFIFWSNSIT